MSGKAKLIVASNRGPIQMVVGEDKRQPDEIRRGGGGLVSGMQSALAKTPDALWLCAALNDGERQLAAEAPDGLVSEIDAVAEALPGDFALQMLPIDSLTFRQAYNGISNSTLWFLLHMLYDTSRSPAFDASWRRQWGAYERYNLAFAGAMARDAAPGATVMIQDYHLFLAPGMLRTVRPDLRIAHFTHIPWVPPEYYSMLPDDVARELLEGMLGADLLGFHTNRWAGQFEDCVREVLGQDPEAATAQYPLAIDLEDLTERAHRPDVEAAKRQIRRTVGDRLIIGRVDRAELSKNVYRGLLAYRDLLRRYPEWRDRVVHVIYDYPSREDVPEYREYVAAVERLARKIDDEFGTDGWSPVVLEIGHDYPGSLACLRMSDVLFVNSLRDGMNLVVLEGVVLSEQEPAVVLSRETGAAVTLGDDPLLVNPFDVGATAHALHEALSMRPDERKARLARMRKAAVGLPPEDWFTAQVEDVQER